MVLGLSKGISQPVAAESQTGTASLHGLGVASTSA